MNAMNPLSLGHGARVPSLVPIDGSRETNPAIVGGKAFYLNLLHSLGLNVPLTAVLPIDGSGANGGELWDWLRSHLGPSKWPLAVRSSSALEDTQKGSNAGQFLSVLGNFDEESVWGAIDRVRNSGPRMAVVVQPLLEAAWSGVAFSLHPLTHSRSEISLTWTQGLADKLVAGEVAGQSLTLQHAGQSLERGCPIEDRLVDQLREALVTIEGAIGGPVDVEWVIDLQARLWIVQARPVVLPGTGNIPLDTLANFDRLPAVVRNHSKIRLRRLAAECGVTMAPASVEIWSATSPPVRRLPNLGKAAGVSVVLLHPERVNQEIVREFAPLEGADVECFARKCRRYCVRRYPRIANVADTITAVLEAGLRSSWTSIAIAQSILGARATGIVRRSAEGYVIDVALGHFVPKGMVPTSTILLSKEKRVLSALWREQSLVYHFIDGHVVTENDPKAQLRLTDEELALIARSFDALFQIYPDAALEFGIIDADDGIAPYLIDMAEGDVCGMDLDSDLIQSGVLSMGRCRGRLQFLASKDKAALDSHLHNRPDKVSIGTENVIVVAKRASVDLLPYVGAPGVVGFVFEQGAILAHLAVVLREKGIPAISLDDKSVFDALTHGSMAEVDALTRSVPAIQRVNISRGTND